MYTYPWEKDSVEEGRKIIIPQVIVNLTWSFWNAMGHDPTWSTFAVVDLEIEKGGSTKYTWKF